MDTEQIDALRCYGVACNHAGCSEIKPGARCYVTWLNEGNGSDRLQIWCRSRGGRSIVKIESIDNLQNFRAVWIPDHVRNDNRITGAPWFEKATAEQIVADLVR